MAYAEEVDDWFDDYEHPTKDAMMRVREIIMSDDRMTETIKWKSPTFMYRETWPVSTPAPSRT